jgi:hypothetical protein
MWAWVGIVYHGLYFSVINTAALGFAVLFFLQATLFGVHAVTGGGLEFRTHSRAPDRGGSSDPLCDGGIPAYRLRDWRALPGHADVRDRSVSAADILRLGSTSCLTVSAGGCGSSLCSGALSAEAHRLCCPCRKTGRFPYQWAQRCW